MTDDLQAKVAWAIRENIDITLHDGYCGPECEVDPSQAAAAVIDIVRAAVLAELREATQAMLRVGSSALVKRWHEPKKRP